MRLFDKVLGAPARAFMWMIMAVARSSRTPGFVLEFLSGARWWEVREAVAQNGQTWPFTLVKLVEDPHPRVGCAAITAPRTPMRWAWQATKQNIWYPEAAYLALIQREDMTVEILGELERSLPWGLGATVAEALVERRRDIMATLLMRFA